MTIRKGQAWGTPARGAVDVELTGGDADLARCVHRSGAASLVRYRPGPTADFARALGLGPNGPAGELEVTVDALAVETDHGATVAINAIVVGVAPDRARFWTPMRRLRVTIDGRVASTGPSTGVVAANGQFVRGLDLVPRGHPGDGRFEVQVYALRRGERRAMRRRLPTGSHVPHPHTVEQSGRDVEIVSSRPLPIEADGRPFCSAARVRIRVLPRAIRILV